MKARPGIALLSGVLLLAPAVGHATWSLDPVTVHATTDNCPLVAAASDAQDGAIVVWQQDDAATPGVYRLLARRLLANGDVDAAWPAAGATVSSATVNRVALGALGDGGGGAYVWWMEQTSLYLTRMLSDGTIAPDWPARGKSLGTLFTSAFRPLVFADGQGGIWLGWLMGDPVLSLGRIVHLGPDGLGAGGWPNSGRGYGPSPPSEIGEMKMLAFTFAPATGGGAWVAWGDVPFDVEGQQFHAGSWRLKRVTSTGLVAPGGPDGDPPVGVFRGDLLGDWPAGPTLPYFAASPVAVAPDGADGAYVLFMDVDSVQVGYATPRLFHLDAAGLPVSSWPAAGVVPFATGAPDAVDNGALCSLRLFPEAGGGVFALRPSYYSEGFIDVTLDRVTPAGTQTMWSRVAPRGFECIVPLSGDTYLASYYPNAPYSPFEPNAYLQLEQVYGSGADGPGFYEQHDGPPYQWYGDIGLAPTSDAGAIFAWSQVRELQGVFARRFTQTGQVTGVEPVVTPSRALRLRFAPGRGVVATLGAVGAGRIRLLDVAGRVCAGTEVPAGAREVAIEGTATLAPGLYFARHLGADGAVETGRVVIVR